MTTDATRSTDVAVSMDDVGVWIDGSKVLSGIDLTLRRNERWAVLGPNGSGKTTLLAIAGARRQPSTGTARILGIRLGHGDVRLLRPRIGHCSHMLADMMPPGLRAEDVVVTGRRSSLAPWFDDPDEEDRRHARGLLSQVGCDGLGERTFSTLSQGERQRVLIGRALYRQTEVLILDEPAAGLDFPARERLIAALEQAAHRPDPPTMLMATHHLEEIPSSVTHAALLRGGTIVAAGRIGDILTRDRLTECFGIDVEVGRRNGRWSAVGA